MENNRILLIEDDVNFIWVAKSFLNTLDIKIIIAKNGQDALRLLFSSIALILMSVWLPDMDTSKLRQHYLSILKGNYIPIIAIGSFSEDIKPKCLEFGFDNYLQKPTSLRIFTETIEKWVQ